VLTTIQIKPTCPLFSSERALEREEPESLQHSKLVVGSVKVENRVDHLSLEVHEFEAVFG
jgi:hypothetical protein